jgi:hypothetical protein
MSGIAYRFARCGRRTAERLVGRGGRMDRAEDFFVSYTSAYRLGGVDRLAAGG